MQVVIDGIIFESHSQGGVLRVFQQVLPKLCELDTCLKIDLITSGRTRSSLPTHPNIHLISVPPIDRLLRPTRFFLRQQLYLRSQIQRLWMHNSIHALWHSTYYTTPTHWKGPIVQTVYDLIHERFPNYFHDRYSREFVQHRSQCLADADMIVCISETTKRDVIDFYHVPASKLIVIPLAAGDIFSPKTAIYSITLPTFKPFLLYIGRRERYKNFIGFVHAYARWKHKRDIDVIAVGSNWTSAEQDKFRQLNISSQVHLIENVDDQQLCELYMRALAFVYPSQYEGFGIPLLEAMACGCPVVAPRIPSTLEVAKDYPVYFDIADQDSFVIALNSIVEDRRAICTDLGLMYAGQYSWERTSKQILDVYWSLCG
jgi:glycosyltransferase involved in cell wall biosynthesis